MVGAVKRGLHHVIPPNVALRDDELETAVISIEAVINSRPLTYVSNDADDVEPLTPGHFLAQMPHAPLAQTRGEVFSCTKRWHSLQRLLDDFWKRFRDEFFPTLHERSKWLKKQRCFQEGDVVVVFEEEWAKKWPLGIVQSATRSELDGLVRVVEVKIGDKTYARDVTRLCLVIKNE